MGKSKDKLETGSELVKMITVKKIANDEKITLAEIKRYLAQIVTMSGKVFRVDMNNVPCLFAIDGNGSLCQREMIYFRELFFNLAKESNCSDTFIEIENTKFNTDIIYNEILHYCRGIDFKGVNYTFHASDKDVKCISFKSDKSLTWCKLPFDLPDDDKPTPVIDEFVNRLSHPDSFKCFIASIFIPESSRQQYLWIKGEGNDGKSCFFGALKHYLDVGMTSEVNDTKNRNQFWTAGLIGKRVILFDDNMDPALTMSGLFKTLTGSNYLKCEIKGGARFDYKTNCKLIVLSNPEPAIGNDLADKRRLIYQKIETYSGVVRNENQVIADMVNEFPWFLRQCFKIYNESCPNHGRIPVDVDAISYLADSNECELESHIDEMIIVGDSYTCTPIELQKALRMQSGLDKHQKKKIRQLIERRFGESKRETKNAPRLYRGFKARTFLVASSQPS